jgi:proton-dependent oligopeptide transporter, POT family
MHDTDPAHTPEPPAKHPRGLYTLFFTEMWERFSYYGMRALLVLFMVDTVEHGGLGFDDKTATSIYGLYTAFVYLVALPGGWIADRLLGAQRSVWYGAMIIALGHFVLAIPSMQAFFVGLVLVVLGTGLLKPNISAIVGQLYPEGGGRRDAGFTIFYMGINLGAAIGPLICSTLGEKLNWHYGFAAAGVGMLFGLAQFKLTARHLGTAGLTPHRRPGAAVGSGGLDRAWYFVGGAVVLIFAVVLLALTRVITFNPIVLAQNTTYVIVGIAVAYFAGIFIFGKLDTTETKRTLVIVVLLLCAALFWSGFEQAGSSLSLFAERYTERSVSWLNFEIPAGWFQTLNPAFIIALAPVVAALWVNLARRHLNPSVPMKFAIGMIFLGVGFLVMVAAAKLVVSGNKVAPYWLICTYLLHTTGELCLSPVGLSAVTKLAPARFVGQMMGLWFVAASLGNLIAGLFAGEINPEAIEQMPDLYLRVVIGPVVAGIVLIAFVRPIRKLMGGVR